MHNTVESNIEIPLSKRKLILMLIGSLLFVVFGIWIVVSPQTFVNSTSSNYFILIIGYIAIFFFGLCTIYIIRRLPENKPGLIISDNYILDNSGALAAGKIKWSDIATISFIEINRQKIILLQVTNPKEYISNQSNKIRRKLMTMNFQMYGTPLSISSTALKIPFEELLALLNQRLIYFKQETLI